jgi:putative ABC transport system ATP-binding protein
VPPVIQLEGVGREYGSGAARVAALAGITLSLQPGEFVAVAGPSGSGKTTLLNLVGALDAPTSGTVRVEERDLAALSAAALSDLRLRRIGFVFQDFNLIQVLSAAENVELPLLFRRDVTAPERSRRVAESLARVGLEGKGGRLPADLSGGERQRAAVARAFAGEPAIVLADEPTANLDHATGGALVALMREINRERGTTFLYATHDPELIRLAGRVVGLRDGRLVEGAP